VGRFLIVVPPLAGHTNPTVAVGAELRRRGHHVAWCGYPEPLGALLPSDTTILPVAPGVPDWLHQAAEDTRGERGVQALRFLWEGFIVPLAHDMVPGVEAAVDAFSPDVVVADQQALAGAVVAKRRKLPWATSATTSAELIDPLGTMPKLTAWIEDMMRQVQLDHGVAPSDADQGDLRFSDYLLLAFTSPALVGRDRSFPPHWTFVGPATAGRPETAPFPWEWLAQGRRHVLVSMGTVNTEASGSFFDRVLAALDGTGVRAVLVAPPDLVPDPLPDVLVRPSVPQLPLLERMDAVVCHGGHNTACEALARGVPLVVAPIRDDQPVVAAQVVAAGAGIRVKFGRVGPAELRAAILAVLDDPAYRDAARQVAESFARAGGAPMAATRLEALLPVPEPV
jgi:MGT family glycosyltransferase